MGDTGTDGSPGEIAPALVGPTFATRWHGLTVGEMFRTIRRAMPLDRPGTLKPDATADVLSYLLRMNDFPPGDADLEASEEHLDQILIARAP